MSSSFSTFIMGDPGVVVTEEEEDGVERLVPHHHPPPPPPPAPPTHPNSYQTFLPQTAHSTTPTTTTTFLTAPPDTFLTLPEQVDVEGGEGEELLGSGDGEEVSQGSLLYLDPTSALHVLVHHLPQPAHPQPTPPQLVEEQGTQEQFVVVGALKTDEDLGSHSPPTTCHVSVGGYLEEEVGRGEGGDVYLPQLQDSTPAPQDHLPPTPVLTLVGDGGDEAGEEGGGGAAITLNRMPQITLEEIIQKFASSPDSPISDITDPTTNTTTTTTTITALLPPSPPPPPPSPPPPVSITTTTASLSPRVKVKLLPEVVKGGDDDDECLYDVVVMYKCRVCGEGFEDKSHLLQHHHLKHKQGGVIKIRVTTSNTPTTTTTITTSPLHQLPSSQSTPLENEHKEINIHSCEFCTKDSMGLRECKEHMSKEHPSKRPRDGGLQHYTPKGSQVKYPHQPGILIGHRKARTPGQGEASGTGGGGGGEEGEEVEGKRKVRTPRALQEQFWLQKQRPKPVCSTEVEKKHKCSVSTCKYKFSSEDKLQAHKDCHGGGGGKLDERGFTCTHCGFRCDKWSVCQLHLWKDHGQDIDLLTCGICHSYKTCTQQRLLVHQKIHSDARDHICKTCGKGFKQLAQLLNHQVQHITNPKDIPAWADKAFCEECQTWLRDKRTLKIHNALVHLKVKPHSCPHCSYRCSKKFALKVHMRQHTGERPHRCPLCGWQASDHNTMRRHKLGHQDSKPFHCPDGDCAFKTRHPTYFKRHMARRHPNCEALYKCEFCPLHTACMQEYVSHSMKHQKELMEQKLKQARELALENSIDNITNPREQEQESPTSTSTTTSILKAKTTAIKKHLTNPILLNPKMEVITIKIDSEEGKTDGGVDSGGDEVVIEEGDAVPLPQVVMSENDSHYIIGLSEFNPTTTTAVMENGDECHVITKQSQHMRDKQDQTHHSPPPPPSLDLHLHTSSPSDNITIT